MGEFEERMWNKVRFGLPLTNKTYKEMGCLPFLLVPIIGFILKLIL